MTRILKLAVLHLGRLLGLFAVARRLTAGKLRILCYHGFELEDESAFRPKLFMKRATFERRMRALAASDLPVMPLGEAVRLLQSGRLPPCATVITIDDGFYSVLEIAAPVLRALSLPSTLYVSTYYVRKQTPIYQVLVQYVLWKAAAAGKEHVQIDVPWGREALDLGDGSAVGRIVDRLVAHGSRCATEEERQEIAQVLARSLEVDLEPCRRRRTLSLLSIEELKALEAQGMAIEMHTHRHRFPPQDLAACRRELADNAAVLEPALGRRTRHFCYPSGIWDRSQWDVLAAAGIESATTCEPGLNEAQTPPHALRRFLDSEAISQIEFEAELAGFSELLRRLRAALAGRPAAALAAHTVQTGE